MKNSFREAPLPIRNFTRLSPLLYRGGVPGKEGLEYLQTVGIRTIVDFQNRPDREEKNHAARLGLRYLPVPWSAFMHRSIFYSYIYRIAARFLEIAADPGNLPLYVHCYHGRERTGSMIAAYRIAVDRWPYEKARDEMLEFGVNPWLNFHLLFFLRRFARFIAESGASNPRRP